MFRTFVLALCVAVALGGVIALWRGAPVGWVFLIEGAVAALAVALQFDRYRKHRGRLDASWQKTEERFVDPNSGALVDVWYRPSTGERAYRTAAQTLENVAAE